MRNLGRLFAVRDFPAGENLTALYRDNLAIAWPAAVEGALMSIISSIDTMMVGGLGSAAIAAVGLTAQPRMILLILAQALSVGTTAVVARRKGAGDQRGARRCLCQSLVVVTVLGVLISLIGSLGARPLMDMAGANEETMEMSVAYFEIVSLGFVFNSWSLCICAALRAIGQARITMVTNITANVVNVILNYLLIGGHFGFPALGIRGAAIATVIGTVAASLLALLAVLRPSHYLYLSLRDLFRFDRATMSSLMKVGSSSIAESAFLRVGFLITAKLIAGIGTAAFAAYQIVMQVTNLSFTLGDGIASAGATLVGQSLGAGRKDLAMTHTRISRRLSVFTSLALMVLIVLFRRQIASLFTSEEEIIGDVSLALLVVLAGILTQNGRVVYSGCLRGAGDVRFVAVCSLLSVMLLRPVLTYLFCYPVNAVLPSFHLAVTGPWLAFVLDSYMRDALLAARIHKGKWMEIKL